MPIAASVSQDRIQAIPAGRSQLAELRAPMTVRIGSRTFWFFLMVLGERPSRPRASQSPAACRTVYWV
jgi:hypothetical protein